MPEVFRAFGLVFSIYPDDHDPPHVHVRGAGWEIKITLQAAPVLRTVRKAATPREARKALQLVKDHMTELSDAWRNIHD